MTTNCTLKAYVACLASYSSGCLHGRWVDCTQGEDHIRDEIAAMLRESPCPNVTVDCPDCQGDAECQTCNGKGKVPSAEEWAVHDWDCDCGSVSLGEYPDVETVAELGEALQEHGAALLAWMANGNDLDTERFREAYRGSWRSLEDYADELLDDMGVFDNAPAILRTYFDVDSFARDLELNGDIWTAEDPDGGVFVFDNC